MGIRRYCPHLTVLSEEDLMGDIQKRLDNVRQMIQSQDFLEGKGLSNEVNIRIFCYEPRDEMAVRHFIEQLSTDMTLGCQLRICNLFSTFALH